MTYPQDFLSKVIQGNCLEVMKQMPDKCVDLVLTDPPYNARNIGPNERKYDVGVMQLPPLEYQNFCQEWFQEAFRVSKAIVFTSGIANVCFYPQPDWIVFWHKPAAVSFNRFGGFNAWEPIMLYGKIAKGKHLGQDYIRLNNLNFSNGIEKGHPCPKPLELMRFLLDRFLPQGGVVLDPFMGSGTTAVAAVEAGRDFIGIEISEKYCDMTNQRVESVTPAFL